MRNLNVVFSRSTVLWTQVLGLALMQGAIALLWVIYNLYIPQLLAQFGFPAVFFTGLLIVENLLAIVMEPLMGSLSDRTQRLISSRFPFIAVGVVLASASFILIPMIVVFGNPVGALRWVLPLVIIAWALAMTVFRSPALSLLGGYALGSGLPQAASVLTLVGALVGAVGLAVNQFILRLGAPVAFTSASLILLASAAVLRRVHPVRDDRGTEANRPIADQPISFVRLGLIFGAGVGITLGFILLRKLLGSAPQGSALMIFTLAHLVSILPAGMVASQVGNPRMMLTGTGGLVWLMGLLAIVPNAINLPLLGVALGVSFSPVAVAILPFALTQVSPNRAGLGTGMYFGGAALAGSIFGAFLAQPQGLSASAIALLSALMWLVAAVCIAISTRSPITHTKSS